jgi:hypothetical protein
VKILGLVALAFLALYVAAYLMRLPVTVEQAAAVVFGAVALGIELTLADVNKRPPSSARRIVRSPGTAAERFLRCLPFSKRGKAEVFDQLIADMRQDYIEAIAARREWRARAVVLHGYATFAVTLVLYIGSAGLKRVVEIWKLV